MRGVLLLVVLALTAHAQDGRFERFCSRSAEGRTTRGLPCGEPLAFFEFAPASGAGMGTECACAAVTGANGEAMTFTRASNGTCTKGTNGLRATGIADGDLVTCSTNQPRAMRDADGVLGLHLEMSRTNALLRFIDYANAAWADVGTPTLTGGQTSAWVGTYASSAVTIDDNDAAAFEGRTQTVTVSAGAAYTMSCYVKAGTATSASVSLDGTTGSVTGLSTSHWDIVSVTDASSSGASIAAVVRVGNATTVTGSVVWGGCQVEAGDFRTSMIPTEGSAVARAADPYADVAGSGIGPDFSIAASIQTVATTTSATTGGVQIGAGAPNVATVSRWTNTLSSFAIASTNSVVPVPSWGAAAHRLSLSDAAGSRVAMHDGVPVAAPVASMAGATSGLIRLGTPNASSAIISRICVDPNPSRCR